jgi:hypothetical protein
VATLCGFVAHYTKPGLYGTVMASFVAPEPYCICFAYSDVVAHPADDNQPTDGTHSTSRFPSSCTIPRHHFYFTDSLSIDLTINKHCGTLLWPTF